MTMFQTNLLGVGVLLALAAALVVWIVIAVRRMPFKPVQSVLYGVNYVLARVLWRAEVQGSLSLPPGQGAVIVCNHHGPVDPSFLYLATHRVVYWMVAKEYVENPALGWVLRRIGAIPVNRKGADTAAIRMAIRYAQNGGVVGLFPEGRINTSKMLLLPGHPGAALIALRTRVPVVPCYVSGSPSTDTAIGPLVTPAKARLVIGEPIDLSAYYGREGEREVREELTRRFLREIARLAGEPDFEPQLAGRQEVPRFFRS